MESALSSSIGVTIKILEVTYQLKAVDEQTADLLSTTSHVDFMVQEARRLRRLKASLLNNSESTMIDKVISDTESALRAVAKLVEPCRVDKETKNSIKFGHRVMWVFRDNPNVRDKHQMLQVCHQSLTIAFNCLYSKDVVVIAPSPAGTDEEQPPPYDPQLKELFDWTNRRKGRKRLGEREAPINDSLSLTSGGLSHIPAAGPSSPCLLPIPLEDDGKISSISPRNEMRFKLPAVSPLEARSSVPCDSDKFSAHATASRQSAYSPISAQSTILDEKPSLAPYNSLRSDSISPTSLLPEVDSTPFATMLAPESLHNVRNKDSHWEAPLSPVELDATTTSTSSTTSLPPPDVRRPASSKPILAEDPMMTWLASSRHGEYGLPEPTTASDPRQTPLRTKSDSNIQPQTACNSVRNDVLPGRESLVDAEDKAMTGGVKRAGRSWLAYQAIRSETGHSTGWDG